MNQHDQNIDGVIGHSDTTVLFLFRGVVYIVFFFRLIEIIFKRARKPNVKQRI